MNYYFVFFPDSRLLVNLKKKIVISLIFIACFLYAKIISYLRNIAQFKYFPLFNKIFAYRQDKQKFHSSWDEYFMVIFLSEHVFVFSAHILFK